MDSDENNTTKSVREGAQAAPEPIGPTWQVYPRSDHAHLVELRNVHGRSLRYTDRHLDEPNNPEETRSIPLFVAELDPDNFDSMWPALRNEAVAHIHSCLRGDKITGVFDFPRDEPKICFTNKCTVRWPGRDDLGELVVKRAEWPRQSRITLARSGVIVLEVEHVWFGSQDGGFTKLVEATQ